MAKKKSAPEKAAPKKVIDHTHAYDKQVGLLGKIIGYNKDKSSVHLANVATGAEIWQYSDFVVFGTFVVEE